MNKGRLYNNQRVALGIFANQTPQHCEISRWQLYKKYITLQMLGWGVVLDKALHLESIKLMIKR